MTPLQLADQARHRTLSAIYRKGKVVHHVENNDVLHTGKSINDAKRFVRKDGRKSYNL